MPVFQYNSIYFNSLTMVSNVDGYYDHVRRLLPSTTDGIM